MLGLIKIYQRWISPFLPPHCRFLPTCSSYAADAINQYGTVRGGALAIKRVCKCHPFHPGGYDPVPTHQSADHSCGESGESPVSKNGSHQSPIHRQNTVNQ